MTTAQRIFSAALLLPAAALAQTAMEFKGTIGQQPVRLTLTLSGDAITSGRYRYESQTTDVALDEGRLIGSTVILADGDGNVFHLHLKLGDGTGTSNLSKAAGLSGTLNRDELELPVSVTRTAGK